MTTCLICANEALQVLPLTNKSQLADAARGILHGIRQGVVPDGLKSQRPGICAVERCARLIEESCGGCAHCQRCSIAAELRAAEGRINADRDAELAALERTDDTVHRIIDQLVEGLCGLHAPLGTALIEECYARKLLSSPAGAS